MKKIISLVVILLVFIGLYFYNTRPVAAPTQDIQTVSAKLPAGSTVSNVYRIQQTDSKVEFSINELLYGKPKLVIGTTNQVAGDISLSKDSQINIGELKISASTFVTDSTQRNGALARLILHADKPENEYIIFKPTSNDLKESIVLGKEVVFNVSGDLTISGVTKPATFKVVANVTADSITGTAEATVKRGDFNLIIPNFSFLANVDESFKVNLTIVAKKIMQ